MLPAVGFWKNTPKTKQFILYILYWKDVQESCQWLFCAEVIGNGGEDVENNDQRETAPSQENQK